MKSTPNHNHGVPEELARISAAGALLKRLGYEWSAASRTWRILDGHEVQEAHFRQSLQKMVEGYRPFSRDARLQREKRIGRRASY